MANRTYPFEITWCWKEDGNRPSNIEEITEISATTVPRAISKLARLLSDEMGEQVKASELMVIDVRNHKVTTAIIDWKKENNRPTPELAS